MLASEDAKPLMDAEKLAMGSPSEPTRSEPDCQLVTCGGTGPADESARDEATPALSKNAQKRLRKSEAFQVKKLAKKEQKKEQKQDRREREEEARKRDGGGSNVSALSEPENQSNCKDGVPVEGVSVPVPVPVPGVVALQTQTQTQGVSKAANTDLFLRRASDNFCIIIDCSWEDHHTQSTLNSLTQQIMFCHGLNRKHSHPAPVYLTGVGPLVTHNLSKVKFQNWAGVSITSGSYIEHPHFDTQTQTETEMASNTASSSSSHTHELVYLTSDAPEILSTLSPHCAYIIGGIVDRNMHKGATYKKAISQKVRTARLPIKENFSLAATHVLTVNHVFHILLNYAKYQDWKKAISEVLPARKQLTPKVVPKVPEVAVVDKVFPPKVDKVPAVEIAPSSPTVCHRAVTDE
jgi:hypothetical protein